MTGGRVVRIVCALVAFGLIALTSLSLIEWIGETTRYSTRSVEARDITAIDVHTNAGAIVITGGDQDTIEIRRRASYTFAEPKFDEVTDSGTLTLDAHCSRTAFGPCDVGYTITVPARIAVRGRSGGGSITVRDIEGAVDIYSAAGGARAERVAGALLIRSSAGGITGSDLRSATVEADTSAGSVRLSFVEAPDAVRATTDAGSVTVIVPDDPTTYHVTTDIGVGSEKTLIRTDPASPHSITASSSAGSVTLRYPTS